MAIWEAIQWDGEEPGFWGQMVSKPPPLGPNPLQPYKRVNAVWHLGILSTLVYSGTW